MTKDEQSLLLYFETCLVDNRGQTRGARMNKIDFAIAKDLSKRGLVKFSRIPFEEIETQTPYPVTHRVQFANKTWGIVHKLRRKRAERYIPTIITREKEQPK